MTIHEGKKSPLIRGESVQKPFNKIILNGAASRDTNSILRIPPGRMDKFVSCPYFRFPPDRMDKSAEICYILIRGEFARFPPSDSVPP